MNPFLTDEEVAGMCSGLEQKAAKVRYLRDLGLTVNTKPNGAPLVVRSHAEAVLAGRKEPAQGAAPAPASPGPQPNRAALLQIVGGRARGPQAKVQPA